MARRSRSALVMTETERGLSAAGDGAVKLDERDGGESVTSRRPRPSRSSSRSSAV